MNAEHRVPKYRVDRVVGQGTMGSVVLATNEHDGTRVALKRVPVFGSHQARERLRREARTLQSLDHPNILPVLEVLEDDGDLAIVTPFASRGSLADRLRHGPLDPVNAAALVARLADALHHAHQHGVVHRDVKPSNVLFDDDDQPLLADFGIARHEHDDRLTEADRAIGTAGFIDPAVIDGAPAGPKSDQYSLGVLAFEVLTGTPPFGSGSTFAVLRGSDLAQFSPLRRDTFGSLAWVIERAFARNPEHRWRSLAEFRDAVIDPPEEDLRSSPSPTPLDRLPADDLTAVDDSTDTRPDALDETRTFRRRSTVRALSEAKPTKASHRRRNAIAATVVLLAGGLGAGAAAVSRGEPKLSNLEIPSLPACNPQTTTQCVRSALRTANGMTIEFASGERVEFGIGSSDDAIRVANWFCGERATLALYQPKTGVIYYLNSWPTPTSDSRPLAVADQTGIVDAHVGVGDRDNDGCADLALDTNGRRTWFLPSKQTARLEPIELLLPLSLDEESDTPRATLTDSGAATETTDGTSDVSVSAP